MVKKLGLAGAALVLLAPMLALLSIGVLMNPAAGTACTVLAPGVSGLVAGNIPNSLSVTTADGTTFTLNRAQLAHAATIIDIGGSTNGINRDGIQIALMAALTESTLRMLTNTAAYPESANYPNDGDGSDNDSLGLFQMRAAAGWGTVAELMDATFQAKAFYGGPGGPNGGSPRGLLDIPGWHSMDKGEAAQAVEVSAYPDHYRNYEPVAGAILDTLTTNAGTGGAGGPVGPESSRVVFPLPDGTWVMSSPFGMRLHPITGEHKLHTGSDFSAADGTPIVAAADGIVTVAGPATGYGNLIVIEHTIGGQSVATGYAHMWDHGIHVAVGDRVTAGQHIGDVGSSGYSTGAHLHFEVRPGGTNSPPIDPVPWLNSHGAANLPTPATAGTSGEDCNPTVTVPGLIPTPIDGDPNRMVDDPTSNGQITARLLNLYTQTLTAFPDTSWACYSPRPGTRSEHPLGRACDITFGNAIGQHPTPAQREAGWAVTNWMKNNADVLGVEYLIWQGKIWSVARNGEGWRNYDGGGMHNPGSVTGGHYDHLHVTVKTN